MLGQALEVGIVDGQSYGTAGGHGAMTASAAPKDIGLRNLPLKGFAHNHGATAGQPGTTKPEIECPATASGHRITDAKDRG